MGARPSFLRRRVESVITPSTSLSSSSSHSLSLRKTTNEKSAQKINVKVVFAALHKLLCVFEIKESLETSLIDEIVNPKHCKEIGSQLIGVKQWISKYTDIDLSLQEMSALIQYVEVYQPLPVDETQSIHSLSTQSLPAYNTCSLICPYCSEVATWAAAIRSEEWKKNQKMECSTRRLERGDSDITES